MNTKQETRMMGSWRARIGALAVWLCAAMPALAQNSIQAINSTQQAGVEVVDQGLELLAG